MLALYDLKQPEWKHACGDLHFNQRILALESFYVCKGKLSHMIAHYKIHSQPAIMRQLKRDVLNSYPGEFQRSEIG